MLLESDSMATHRSSGGRWGREQGELSYYMPGWLNYFSPDLGRAPEFQRPLAAPQNLVSFTISGQEMEEKPAHHRSQGWPG